MTKLLISGSREASEAMLQYTIRAVTRASTLGWTIIVGDAEGIDHMAITQAFWCSMKVENFGITPQPRTSNNFTIDEGAVWPNYTYTQVQGDYLARDRHMAELCDRALCIWNGTSTGTLYTHKAVIALGKRSDLIDFSKR